MDLFIQFAYAAAEIAVKDSGIDPASLRGERTGVYIGSGIGGIGIIEDTHKTLLEKVGAERLKSLTLKGGFHYE